MNIYQKWGNARARAFGDNDNVFHAKIAETMAVKDLRTFFCFLMRIGELMGVKKIMSSIVVTVEMDDSLRRVKKIFDSTRFHHLLVVGSGKLVGVISDRDLLKVLSPNIGTDTETVTDTAILNKKVHQIMTREPIVVEQHAGIFDAITIFNNHTISCIPVVDDSFKPVGILSWRDIMNELESFRNTHQGCT